MPTILGISETNNVTSLQQSVFLATLCQFNIAYREETRILNLDHGALYGVVPTCLSGIISHQGHFPSLSCSHQICYRCSNLPCSLQHLAFKNIVLLASPQLCLVNSQMSLRSQFKCHFFNEVFPEQPLPPITNQFSDSYRICICTVQLYGNFLILHPLVFPARL